MTGRLSSLAVVVVALASYHLAQRSMPEGIRPAALFAFVYGIAAVVMAAIVVVGGSGGGWRDVAGSGAHWAPWLLVVAVSGIELGVLAMYRAGWTVSTASISTQAIVAGVLVVAGLLLFGERLTVGRSLGVLLCVLGAGLVAR